MSFFIKGKQVNGLKRTKYSSDKNKKRKINKTTKKNEEITSSEDEEVGKSEVPDPSSSEDEHETAQEKKIRLAKAYLKEIEKEEKARLENEEIDVAISKRLKEDYLKETGKFRITIADQYKNVDEKNAKILKSREHRNSITCFCLSSDSNLIYAGSKDGVVVKYSLSEEKKIGVIPFVKQPTNGEIIGHSRRILSLAISTDNKFLVVGTDDSDIFIWDPSNLKFIKKLFGHKNAITGLCFKKDSHTLYSCSKDRTAKLWNLDEMTYIETLFGHQDSVASIDTLFKDRVVTSGGRDLRIWKITEETQLIFNGHVGNIDIVKMLNEEHFMSGGDDGQICIWSIMRKKPLHIIQNAHGIDPNNKQPLWISAIASLVNSDLIASGSQDGHIKLWKLTNNFKTANLLFEIAVEGFVNDLSFTSDGNRLIAAISKEHKFGRWTTIKSAKNCIMIFPFIKESVK